MEKLAGFDFVALEFDRDGNATSTALDTLQQHIGAAQVTDVVLIAHGFRNSEQEARGLYEEFLTNFRAHLGRDELNAQLSPRVFAVGGVLWPSKKFDEGPEAAEGGVQGLHNTGDGMQATRAELERIRDEDTRPSQRPLVDQALLLLETLESSPSNQDAFVALMLDLIDETESDPTEGFTEVKAQSGSELLNKLGAAIILPTRRDDDDGSVMSRQDAGGGGSDGKPLFIGGVVKTLAGKVGQFLNMTTWYTMKNRAGVVGANGVASAVRQLKQSHPAVRVHLVGHSLGGRGMAACAKDLCVAPTVQPDSLSLLEAAFSHYGLSDNNGHGTPGFFRDVIAQQIIKGPFISTYSYQDTVVGTAYAISSRLAGDNVKAVGDKDDQYGGIGRNGTQRTTESTNQPLREVGEKYDITLARVNNLDGSGGGIKNHGDVRNPRVTYAFACAVAMT
ncbi:MAG: hypothetical protein ABI120_23855 [Gemmatimonadaceae bacterium]